MKVILNPGHSATSPGHTGLHGLTEREVVEAVARELALALGQRMIQTEIMQQPAGDPAAALTRLAARLADEPYDIDMLLSLHCSWSDEPAAYGLRCLYQTGSEESRLLAECLLRRFPRTPWAAVEAVEQTLLREAACPAVLLELDHLSNPEVATLMTEESWCAKVAANLVDGVFAFIGPQDIRVLVDGAQIHLDPAPQEVYNDVLVPVRVLGSALGASVQWDPRRRVVAITTNRDTPADGS